jgi:hypothetical protein
MSAPLSPSKPIAFRADGWPLCPICGEDELYSLSIPANREEIHGCYRCGAAHQILERHARRERERGRIHVVRRPTFAAG